MASTYVASGLSAWLTRTFTPPSSPTFVWFQGHVSNAPEVVLALSGFSPTTTVATAGVPLHQAIAYHILRTLFYISISASVFLLFVMVWHFSNAVWDRSTDDSPSRHAATLLLSAVCGGFVIWMTGLFIGNIAWLREVPFLAHEVAQSLGMDYVAQAARALNVL